MRGSEYGEQDRKVAILYEYETFKATEEEQLLDTYLHYLQVINDLKKYGYKKDNCELDYKFLNNMQPEWKQYGCSKHMTGNRALLKNVVDKFLGSVRFGNNDFAVIAGYGDVVIGSMTIKKIYYVEGLPKMKFKKDHLCSACEQEKIHQKHHKFKTDFASNNPLYLLHMDLCGPMRIESNNGKRYVLVVVDDYSRYTWVFFLCSKDEAFKFKCEPDSQSLVLIRFAVQVLTRFVVQVSTGFAVFRTHRIRSSSVNQIRRSSVSQIRNLQYSPNSKFRCQLDSQPPVLIRFAVLSVNRIRSFQYSPDS
nr:spindle assembly checkpoint component MAD1-like [Tanacetum cinerariifolium]